MSMIYGINTPINTCANTTWRDEIILRVKYYRWSINLARHIYILILLDTVLSASLCIMITYI